MYNKISDIRSILADKWLCNEFSGINRESSMTDIVGNRMIELIGVTFNADEPSILGKINEKYVKREEEWYYSQSLSVHDFPDGPPKIWEAISSSNGTINSNYGWCIFSEENGNQYDRCYNELKSNPQSRRGTMIYTRPSMWDDYCHDGRSDFMCTNTVQYLVRDNSLHAVVQMRSNDATIGYKNDRHWQLHVQKKLANDLGVAVGNLLWNVGSLHLYERDFYLLENYIYSGELWVKKADYENRKKGGNYNKCLL